jgi:hypothetical protein
MIEYKELNFMLDREHIEFKPSQVYKRGDSVYCNILAYKDARTDMEILDDCIGSMYWQDEYKRDTKGILQCGISIYNQDLSEWVTKWSNGTPSDFESEKGEYSDAFKRAGFMWGIGRCLYDSPRIEVQLMDKEWSENNGKVKANAWFRPNDWYWKITGDNMKEAHIKAAQKFGNTWKDRFDNKPYSK